MRFDRMEISFQGADANITIDYTLDIFTRIYYFFLGGDILKPEIIQCLNIDNPIIEEIRDNRCILIAENVSSVEGNYYVFRECKLGQEIGELVITFPDGSSEIFTNADVIPTIFYNSEKHYIVSCAGY
ncbi:MAG: hypothetical protein ACXQS7_04875 [Candidatus Syntropharchaeia archaeon]